MNQKAANCEKISPCGFQLPKPSHQYTVCVGKTTIQNASLDYHNLVAHRQGDQDLPALLLLAKHLHVEVGVGSLPLDDRQEEVLAGPGEGGHLERELPLKGVPLDVAIVEDSVGLLGDAGEGVRAVAKDVLPHLDNN